MKKIFIAALVFMISFAPVLAKDIVKVKATLQNNLKADYKIGDKNKFVIDEDIIIPNSVVIPAHSTVEAEIIRIQKELRWHKSGYAICRLLNYIEINGKRPVDISDKEIYLIARKHTYLDKKEVTIVTSEILGWSAVSFFAPGVDIAYFFTKGAIIRDKHPNWFKSGVSKAYENSILWFIIKGKKIELDEGDEIQLKYLTEKNLKKRIKKIDKRKLKTDKKLVKKEAKLAKKEIKKAKKAEKEQKKQAKMNPKKLEKYLVKKERKNEARNFKKELVNLRYKIWEEKWEEIDDIRYQELKEQAEFKKEKLAFKNKIKNEKLELKKTVSNLKGKEKSAFLKSGKQNIKNEELEFKNKTKEDKQNKKLAKKELKNKCRLIKKEAKIWCKNHKAASKKECEQFKKEPVVLFSDKKEISIKEHIFNSTFYKKYQAPESL